MPCWVLSQVLTMAGNLPAEHQQNAHEIYRSSGHLLRLIEDLLDLSKIQGGRDLPDLRGRSTCCIWSKKSQPRLDKAPRNAA